MNTEKRKWSKVEAGDKVLIDDELLSVKKIKSGVATLAAPGVFKRVPAEGKVKVVLAVVESPKEKTSREDIEANLRLRNKAAAKANREKRTEAEWHVPADEAEKVIAEVLDAKLLAVSPKEGQPYEVPPVGPATIHAHLMIFHALDGGGLAYPDLVAVHDKEHAEHSVAPFHNLHVPHHHPERRTA